MKGSAIGPARRLCCIVAFLLALRSVSSQAFKPMVEEIERTVGLQVATADGKPPAFKEAKDVNADALLLFPQPKEVAKGVKDDPPAEGKLEGIHRLGEIRREGVEPGPRVATAGVLEDAPLLGALRHADAARRAQRRERRTADIVRSCEARKALATKMGMHRRSASPAYPPCR